MGMRVRQVRVSDEPALLALFAEIKREPEAVAARTVAMVTRYSTYHVVAELDGTVVGRAALVRPPSLPDGTLAAGIGVTATARRRGAGGALWDALVAELPRDTGRLLAFSDDRDDAEVLPFVRARGFAQFQHSVTSEADLTGLPGPAGPPPGFTVEVVEPYPTREDAAVASLYAASDTSPEAQQIGVRTWADELDSAGDLGDRGLLTLVRSQDRPVAMSLAVDEGDGVWHVLYTGVLPMARGQGLALLAKRRLHQELAALGGRRAVTDNEAGNDGIRRVNAELGYVRVQGTRRFVRDLGVDPLR